MRILLIMNPGIPVPPVLYGGIERIVYLLAEEYRRLGHQVTLLAGPGSYCSGNTIIFGTNNEFRSTRHNREEIFFVWQYLLKHHSQFDLIHDFGRLIYLLPVLRKPVWKIMSYQREVSIKGISLINRLPVNNLVFTGCSNYCVSTGKTIGKWKTVYNAIDFSNYHLAETVSEQAPLMFLGRMDKIKGLHSAIKVAFATSSILWIGGNIPRTADNYEYYQSVIEPLIDNQQIVYLGELNDVQKNDYLRRSRALLFPIEWNEPFGIVMIEAMACGTPVIGFNRGAVPEVVDEGITGNVVASTEEMIAAVGTIHKLSRIACRMKAEERFAIASIAKEYLSLTIPDVC